jgi:hypothetical protein
MMLETCVALVESENNPDAIRFEPATYNASKPSAWIAAQVPNIVKAFGGDNVCDLATATMLACTSFGIYQMLGANVWAFGKYTGTLAQFIGSRADQYACYTRFLSNLFSPTEDVTSWTDKRFQQFAVYQNGPGNPGGYILAMKRYAGLA